MSLVQDLPLIHVHGQNISIMHTTCISLVPRPGYEAIHVCIINHPSLPTAPAAPTLQDLSNELTSVHDWHLLGVKLGLKIHELGTIEKDYHGNSLRCKHEMLGRWIQNSELPTWKAVTDALHFMGEQAIASKIRMKYCSSSTATGMC